MPSPFTIVAFGDSMTECKALEPSKRWPGLLQRRLNRASAVIRCEVVNAGVGGNTSREGLARLERDVLLHRPDLTLVQFGGNDATPDPARAVAFDEYTRNLGAIRRLLQRAGSATAWVTFPPVIDVWHAWSDPANAAAGAKFLAAGGLDAYLHEYRRRTRDFASRHGDLCIDLYAGMRQAIEAGGAGQYIARDGVHFTVAGSRRAAEVVAAALQAFLALAARGRGVTA
jgi:lysophospholipase L1-like esterase